METPTGGVTATVGTPTEGGVSAMSGGGTVALTTIASGTGNAQQRLTFSGSPAGGSFTVAYGGLAPVTVNYDASFNNLRTNLQNALDSLLGAGNTKVMVAAGGPNPVLDVYFTGQLAGMNVINLAVSGSGLTGGSGPSVS